MPKSVKKRHCRETDFLVSGVSVCFFGVVGVVSARLALCGGVCAVFAVFGVPGGLILSRFGVLEAVLGLVVACGVVFVC